MPRIAAAIGVFATIAVFIFINIKSYPVVWEMVGTSPWFAQGEESSPQENSAQPEMVAEKGVKKTAPPRPKLKSLADNTAKGNGSSSAKQPQSAKQPRTGPAAAYRGLNLGPIKVAKTVPGAKAVAADNSAHEKTVVENPAVENPAEDAPTPLPASSGSRWPAEMSPRMKYAAKPPILETYQNWNPERPVVPVKQPKKAQKAGDNRDKSPKNASPDPKNPSCAKPPVEQGKETGRAVVRRLPPTGPRDRPILISIPAHGPDSPIPVYPGTGRP